jgi:hypothetical protein
MRKFAPVALGLMLAAGLAGYLFAADSPAEKSITGTLEDSYCYGSMGAKGASHKQCAIACVKKGIPVALVDPSGKIYILLPAKNDEPLPDEVYSKMEDQVTVTGKEYSKGGANFLTAESVK